jgi:HAD superfamily hydrolase (TIGR01549 family)
MIKTIIFDFDGTIADTFDGIKNIAKKELGASDEDFRFLKNNGLKSLFKKSKLPFWKIPKVTFKVLSKLSKRKNLKLFPEIIDLLNELKENYKFGIISSNSEENIREILKDHNIENLFEFIYSESSLFGKSRVIKKVIKKYKFNLEDIIYVGDEDRDIIAAKRSKIKIIAVTWGFNSKEKLLREKPDYLVDTPKGIIDKIMI